MSLTGDTFDFQQGNTVTSSAQMVDNAATVGDVLTVQADKSVAAAPGGGSLPQGWTADASDPANVNTNGGFQRFGSDGGFVVPNAGFIVSDSNVSFAVNGDLDMGSQAITGLPAPTTDSEPATKLYVNRRTLADDESVQYIAIEDADTVVSIVNTAGTLQINGTNAAGTPTFQLTTAGALSIADGSGGLVSVFAPQTVPEIPATPTAQDVTDALVALGLVTQAAP